MVRSILFRQAFQKTAKSSLVFKGPSSLLIRNRIQYLLVISTCLFFALAVAVAMYFYLFYFIYLIILSLFFILRYIIMLCNFHF